MNVLKKRQRQGTAIAFVHVTPAIATASVFSGFRSLVRLPLKDDQTLRIRDWQGAKSDSIDQAEDCRIGANAQRQRGDRDNRKSRRFAQHAPAIAEVLKQRFKETATVDFPQGFTSLLDASKGDQRPAASFLGRHACGHVQFDLALQMETQFVIYVGFLLFTTFED